MSRRPSLDEGGEAELFEQDKEGRGRAVNGGVDDFRRVVGRLPVDDMAGEVLLRRLCRRFAVKAGRLARTPAGVCIPSGWRPAAVSAFLSAKVSIGMAESSS